METKPLTNFIEKNLVKTFHGHYEGTREPSVTVLFALKALVEHALSTVSADDFRGLK